MSLMTDEEFEDMKLIDWVKLILIISVVLSIIILTSGYATPPPCIECLML